MRTQAISPQTTTSSAANKSFGNAQIIVDPRAEKVFKNLIENSEELKNAITAAKETTTLLVAKGKNNNGKYIAALKLGDKAPKIITSFFSGIKSEGYAETGSLIAKKLNEIA